MRPHHVRSVGQARRSPRRRASRVRFEFLEERLAPAFMASGIEFHVNATVANDQKFPAVAMDDSGDYVVAWQGGTTYEGASPYDIFAQRYNAAGVAQGGQITVNADADVQRHPAVAMDDNGDFVVVWESYDAGGTTAYNIFAQRFNAAGVAQGGRISVNTITAGDQFNADVAMDSDGDFVVTWTTGVGAGADIAARRFNANGTDPATGVIGEFQVNTTTTGPQINPSIGMDAAGNFTIVWADSSGQDGAGNGVIGQRFSSSGAAQGGEFVVNTTTTGNQDFPSIAMNESGTFVVAWRGDGSGGSDIFARRFNASAVGQGNEFPVNTTTANAQINPDAAIDSHGNFVVTWVSQSGQDGSGDGVYARRFNLDGSASGGEFPANTTTPGNQNEPAVAMDDNGDAVIVWQDQSKEGDTNGYGIYGQRYTYVNTAPTLDPISNLGLSVSAGQQTVNLAGISAAGGDVQTLTVTATSDNPTLIPSPTVTYTSPGATGSLSFTPAAGMSGTATITVTVADDGGTANGGVNFITRTFTVNVTAPADLAVTKSDSPDPVIAGNSVTYTVTLTNNGPSDAQTVTLTDAVPANTTFVSASLTTGTGWATSAPAVGGTGNVVFSKATVAAGETATFTIVVRVGASVADGSTISNTATAATSSGDSNSGNDTATATTTVQTGADLAVTVTDSPDPVTAGNQLTYTINFVNNGPSDALNVTVTDVIPAGTTANVLISPGTWTPSGSLNGPETFKKARVAPGETATFTVIVTVNPNVADGSTLTNTVTATSDTTDPTPGNDTATATTTVQTRADLTVTVTDSPDPVTAGTDLTYTLTVTNNGPSDAQTVTLTDAIPANTTFVSASVTTGAGWATSAPAAGGTGNVVFSKATMAAGETATFTIVVHVGASVASGSIISNTATAASATTDPNGANDSSTATTTVDTSADLAITKTGPDTVTAGTDVTYNITVVNNGPSDAQNYEAFDFLPNGTTLVSFFQESGPPVGGAIPAGATATFTLILHVNPGAAAGSTITNTANVNSSTSDPDPSNNHSSVTSTVVNRADLVVTKTDSPDPVIAGTDLTYTVTLANNGPGDAQNVTLTDAVPAGTTFVSAAVTTGSGWTTSAPAVGGAGSVVFSKATVALGETATFTIVVHVNANAANGPTQRPPVPPTITNTANAASTTSDPTPGNNTATATTTVIASADLAVTKTDSPDPVMAGNTITYTVTVTNNGPSDAQDVTLQDFLPSNVTFVSDSGAAGWTTTDPAVGSEGGPITAKTNILAAGASATFTVVVRVLSSVADGSVIANSAQVTTTTTESNSGNNAATATTLAHALADLSVTKTATTADPVAPGGTITYVVTVANNGPSDARNVTLTDILSDRLSFVSSSFVTGWTTTNPTSASGGTFTGATPTLVAGGSATFTIVVRVSPNTPSKTVITNQASAVTSTPESGSANNTGTASTLVVAPPTPRAELAITMTATPSPVAAGSKLVYRIVVTNSGPDVAQGVVWTDLLPANATFLAADQTGGPAFTLTTPSVGSSGGTVTGSVASLAPGASATFAIAVKVGSQAVVNRSSVASTNASTKTVTLGTAVGTSGPVQVASAAATQSPSASPSRTPAPDVQTWDLSLERSAGLVADVVRQKTSSAS